MSTATNTWLGVEVNAHEIWTSTLDGRPDAGVLHLVEDVVDSQADLDALDETDSSDRPSHTLSS